MTAKVKVTYRVRPATMDDLPKVVALMNAAQLADVGEVVIDEAELRTEWSDPKHNFAEDTFLFETPEGTAIAYGDVYDRREPLTRVFSWGRVHPDYRGQGIGTHLLEILEERAQKSIVKAPPHARVAIAQGIDSRHTAFIKMLEDRGYSLIRRFYQMRIELDQKPPDPQPIEGIVIRPMRFPEEAQALFEADIESFRDHWGFQPMSWEEFELFFFKREDTKTDQYFLAMDGDQIAGFSVCVEKTPEDPDMAWVDILGVRRPWRRRGIATALLRYTFNFYHKMGKKRVGLGVDAESLTGAVGVYENAGMSAHRVWLRYEKELRPGEDLGVQTLQD